MEALRFDRFGAPAQVLQFKDVPEPTPGADEAVVEIRAAAVNPSDVKNVEGGFPMTQLPRTPGRDFSGVVKAGPPGWQGSAVWGTGGDFGFVRDGAHAQMVLVPKGALRRKPESLTFVQAAAVGTPFVTAHLALREASLSKGDVALVVGAAGAVGSAAVQIAVWQGASVVGLVIDERQAEAARAHGAEQVIVAPPGGNTTEKLRGSLGETAVDLALDTTGVSLDACVHVLRPRGRVAVITAPPDGKTTFNLRELYSRSARLVGVNSLKLSSTEAGAILDELAPGFASGALRPTPSVERRLDEAVAAYQVRGKKIVLVVPA